MSTVKEYAVSWECDHEQYWQGHGISFTKYAECATGCGSSLREALYDALDCLAQSDIELTDDQNKEIEADLASQIRAPYNLDTDITVECDHAEPDENGPVDGEELACAICAGEWFYYVNIDVVLG